jgi:hypothetical protein
MRISAISILLLVAIALPASLPSQAGMPLMRSVEPASGKAGDVVVVEGENLGQENVAAVYLTDGQADIKVQIIEQTATSIKFRIPPETKPGRLALVPMRAGIHAMRKAGSTSLAMVTPSSQTTGRPNFFSISLPRESLQVKFHRFAHSPEMEAGLLPSSMREKDPWAQSRFRGVARQSILRSATVLAAQHRPGLGTKIEMRLP